MEIVELTCEKEQLLDHNWLFGNIPWSNHDSKLAKISFNEEIEIFNIKLDGANLPHLKSVKFDNVIITAFHGFAGNSYSFDFKIGEENVLYLSETNQFGFDAEDVRKRYLERLESKIKGLKWQIGNLEEDIEQVSNIELE